MAAQPEGSAYAKSFSDIPGTTIFDMAQARKGYELNMFCMSLGTAAHREAFKADETNYLERFALTPQQRAAVLARDYATLVKLGGNVFYLVKLVATDGLPVVAMVAQMTGVSQAEHMKMMQAGGRPVVGNRSRLEAQHLAKIIGGIATSHVPAVGAAIDNGRTQEPYWSPILAGFEVSRRWLAEHKPDVVVLVYNDHANAFTLDLIPTFAIGCADQYHPADEGWGPRRVPVVPGHAELAGHIAECAILDEFDLTIVNRMDVDHGLTVPLSLLFGQVTAWPCRVIPVAVNVLQFPPPTANRCYQLGRAIRRAVESYPEDLKVVVCGTGGLSHQLQGERAGLINTEFDREFLDRLVHQPEALLALTHAEYVREAGSEGIEMIMWLVMRGALQERVEEVHRFYHVPASNTAVGHLVLQDAS